MEHFFIPPFLFFTLKGILDPENQKKKENKVEYQVSTFFFQMILRHGNLTLHL